MTLRNLIAEDCAHWKTRAQTAEARVEELTRELDEAREALGAFEPLTAVVEYIGHRDRPNWPAPHQWTPMAAFDSLGVAERYAATCGEDNTNYEYRARQARGGDSG